MWRRPPKHQQQTFHVQLLRLAYLDATNIATGAATCGQQPDPHRWRGYLLILQLGNPVFSSALPASVTFRQNDSLSISNLVSPLRCTSPASVIRVDTRLSSTTLPSSSCAIWAPSFLNEATGSTSSACAGVASTVSAGVVGETLSNATLGSAHGHRGYLVMPTMRWDLTLM